MVEALIESEEVRINVSNGTHEAEARSVLRGLPLERITFYWVPTNEPWCRDHGPIFLTRDREPQLAVVDWDYNAWGNKYPPFDLDEVVPDTSRRNPEPAGFLSPYDPRGWLDRRERQRRITHE